MWRWFFRQFIINYFCTRAVRRVIFNLSAKIFAYQWRAAWNFDVFGCLWGAISVFKLHSRTLKYFWVQLVNDKISMINCMFMFIIRVYTFEKMLKKSWNPNETNRNFDVKKFIINYLNIIINYFLLFLFLLFYLKWQYQSYHRSNLFFWNS